MKPIRLGVVSYLNSEPLVYGLDREVAMRIERDVPARVAERLHAGQVDLGLIPSIEYARGRYAIVPDVSIASRGAVRSVSLYYRGRLEDVRRVALDASSRSSAALARVLLRERLGRDPEYQERPPALPAMLEHADAALAIGDPALFYEGDLRRLDLGEEWWRVTGKPFVFAFWAGRAGAVTREHVARLQRAKAEGLASLPDIASSYNGLGRGRAELSESYLRSNVVYELGDAELAGLREFYERASALRVIDQVPELRFHDHP